MSYFRAYIKTNLQALTELLSLVKKECGGCLPSALTFEESVQRFPEFRQKRNFVVSLLTCDHVESLHQEILIDVWVLKSVKKLQVSELEGASVEENLGEDPQPLTIYLTRALRDCNQLVSNKESCILLRGVTAVPIEKITIGALSFESFQWAKDHLKEFLVNVVNNRMVIIKQNGTLGEMFVQSDLHDMLSMLLVFECVPVMQGLVTANTMLVISDIHQHNLDKWQLKRLKSMQGNSKLADLRWLKMPGTKPPKPSYLTIDMDQPDGSIFGNSKEVLNKLYVSLLEQPLHSESLLVFDQVADIDSQVWITMETMNNLQLNAGTWVRVSICPIKPDMSLGESSSETMNVPKSYNNQVSKFSKIKLAQVFPIEENKTMQCAWQNQSDMMVAEDHAEFSYGTAYISAILLFNLLPSPLDDVKSVLLCLERAELRESPPCFAKEVNISVMTSPLTKITNMYDVILTQHFTTPRLISTDDVLCVYCDWKKLDAPATQAVLDEGLPRSHILYFKVNKLVSKEDEESLSYFVDAKQSILFQDNIEQNYVPSVAELFLHNSVEVKQRVSSYWLTTHPGGLETYVSKLVVMLRSLLLNRDQTTDIFPILLSGPPGVGKKTIVMAASRQLYLHIVEVNCYDIIGDTTAATEARLRNSCQKAFTCAPCILLLSNIHCLGKAKDNIDKEPRITTTLMVNLEEIQRVSTHPVLVLGSTSSIQSMTSDLRACFLDEVDIQGPTESQRVEMLQALSSGFLVGPGVSFKALASRTAGMVLSDFCTMFSEAVIQAQDDVMTYCKGLGLLPEMETTDKDEPSGCEDKQVYHKKAVDLQKDICSAGVLLHQCHFDKAIQMLQAAHSDSIGAPKIPSVSWQDIGGLSDVKEEILDTIQLPFQYPELFAAGLQRSGKCGCCYCR